MSNNNNTPARGRSSHTWRFFRSGGFDQVRIETADDLRNLHQLDQKLWAALACPTRGLELDPKTLTRLDSDGDGRIRAPEVLAAVQWVCATLKRPADITRGADTLPLEAIDSSTPEGARVLGSARQILANLGKPKAEVITLEDTSDTARIFAETRFNGDGIVPATAAEDDATKSIIEDIIRCVGSVTDRSGAEGINAELVAAFADQATAYVEWWAEAEQNAAQIRTLAENTEAAAAIFEAVRAKVDDYFTRSQLAKFDTRAADPLNPSLAGYEVLAAQTLSPANEGLAALPLARIEAGRPLPLGEGLNPAWADPVAKLQKLVVTPWFGERETLNPDEWATIKARFAAYEAWLAAKPATTVESLGIDRLRAMLTEKSRQAIADLISRDQALESEANAIAEVDQLIRYYRDLYTFVNNFVSFRDFYSGKKKGIFQAGTLYLDRRSCELCVPVADAAAHSALAQRSGTFLAYCDCSRRGSDEKMTIAAAISAGDANNLMVGRNGVFYDRQGRDWDATIVKLVEHPISVGQAFWSPYQKVGRMIGEQIAKFAGGKEKAMETKAAAGLGEAAQKAEAGAPAAAAPPFDVGKFAGIFAAIGLAIGALGTALASIVTGLLALKAWQMPVALIGLILLISGPSMLIAYLKLRQRNLAPILDANGWAVNSLAKINIPFGASLTQLAELPPGAERALQDPFAEKATPWKTYVVLALLLAALGYLWHQGYLGRWVGWCQPKTEEAGKSGTPVETPATSSPATPAAPATETATPAAPEPKPTAPATPAVPTEPAAAKPAP